MVVKVNIVMTGFPSRLQNISTRRRLPHPYKRWFVLLPDQCGTSQSTMCQPSRYFSKGVDTGRCAGKDAGPQRDRFGGGPTSIGGRKECQRGRWPRKGWIVMSHISWGGEQTTIYKGVKTFSQQTRFKALKGSTKGKAQREQYLLAVDLVVTNIFFFQNILLIVKINIMLYFMNIALNCED